MRRVNRKREQQQRQQLEAYIPGLHETAASLRQLAAQHSAECPEFGARARELAAACDEHDKRVVALVQDNLNLCREIDTLLAETAVQ